MWRLLFLHLLLSYESSLSADVFVMGIQRFLVVILLMLPFEIRDLKFDNLKLSTIPQKIGVKQTKRFGMVLVGLVFFLEFLKDDISGHQTLVLFIVLLLLLVLLLCSKVEQSKYYSSFWVEGWPILWLLLTLGFN